MKLQEINIDDYMINSNLTKDDLDRIVQSKKKTKKNVISY
jgi:hypothetical protein